MIEIIPIPAFKDNYIWLIRPRKTAHNPTRDNVVVVDPGDAAPVLSLLEAQNLYLDAILLTHHHWDHTNGIKTLLEHFTTAKVYGPHNSPVNTITNRLKENDTFDLTGNLGHCRVIETPGHTLDHISYLIDNHLFCGDTLFSAGCGRLFEGTAKQLHASLNKFTTLPTTTHVYPTHEYTQSNLQFAAEVDATNPAVTQRLTQVNQLRKNNSPTLPSSIAVELASNPFLRCGTTDVHRSVERHAKRKLATPLEVFTELRLWKDHY